MATMDAMVDGGIMHLTMSKQMEDYVVKPNIHTQAKMVFVNHLHVEPNMTQSQVMTL